MCHCQVCGREYQVDVLVPDSIWTAIRPDKSKAQDAGLLCGSCIMERIEELWRREGPGGFCAFEWTLQIGLVGVPRLTRGETEDLRNNARRQDQDTRRGIHP